MRTTISKLTASLIVLLSLGLAACGGGGGGAPAASPPPPAQTVGAEGFWSGTTSNGFGILGAVLENGEYWFMYFTNGVLYGVVQGSGSANNGNFTSTNGLDFYFDGNVTPVTVSASYRERTSLQGTGTPPGGGAPITFTATYEPSYDTPATAAAVSGAWRGRLASGETYTINVGAGGAFTGSGSSGCTFGGSIVPRPSGKAVYDVTVTFNGGVCLLGTQTLRGIAAVTGSGAGQVLYAAALNGARSSGFVAISIR
ncbi:MAG: hypothetical protein ACOY5V_03965 [Pseudomonadota bacterium]